MNTTMISISKLASAVKNSREKLGLTQQDVQGRTGINRQIIGRIEKGQFVPSLPQLNLLSAALNFRIEDLLEEKAKQDAFYAMRGEVHSQAEAEGIEKFFSMMNFLKSQKLIRSKLTDHGTT